MIRSILLSLLLLVYAGQHARAEPWQMPWVKAQTPSAELTGESWEAWQKILANPVSDAMAALGRGDRRLMAVGGYTTQAPGAGYGAMQRHGYVVLDGAEGCVGTGYFRERAREYATRYNQYILQYGS